jgi:hypothetical protein
MLGRGSRKTQGHNRIEDGSTLQHDIRSKNAPSRWSIASWAEEMAYQGSGSDFASTMISKFGGAWSDVGQVGTTTVLLPLYGVEPC